MALATATKGTSSISDYFTKMKGLADDMASAGQRLEDEELVSYILTGLDLEFNSVVSAVAARVEPISIGELYTQLVSFEQRMELHSRGGGFQSSANVAAKGGRNNYQQLPWRPRWRPWIWWCTNWHHMSALCGKDGHTVLRCYKRFDASFMGPPQKSASSATTSYGVDTNWYMDSGATDHIETHCA